MSLLTKKNNDITLNLIYCIGLKFKTFSSKMFIKIVVLDFFYFLCFFQKNFSLNL